MCILHSHDPEKDKKAFSEALSAHREQNRNDFRYVVFPGEIDFSDTEISGDVNFSGATFIDDVLFIETEFATEANFEHATFAKKAWFGLATFAGSANFEFAKFNEADFGSTKFMQESDFRGSKFSKWAWFGGAEFAGKSIFNHANFHARATFGGAKFAGGGDFLLTTFNREANFGRAEFLEHAFFERTKFKGNAYFHRVHFADVATFYKSNFYSKALFFPEWKGDCATRDLIFCGVRVDLRALNLITKPLDGFMLRDADLEKCWIRGTDVRKIEFSNVRWPKIGRRFVVYDEIDARERGETDEYPHIERLYRELKQNYEDRKDYERASDFHYGEKEMRRKNPETHRGLRFLLTLYWLVSGYGERWVRPLIWAAGLLVVCAVLYLFMGMHPKNGGPALSWTSGWDWQESILYSIRVMTLLKPDDLLPGGLAAKFLNTFQSIVGPIILGLFALAVRQRLKR